MINSSETNWSDHSQVLSSASYIRSLLPPSYIPTVGIIGGSGLSTLEDAIGSFESSLPRLVLTFDKVPGFPVPSVHGHAGKLIFGTLVTNQDKRENAVAMSGRVHIYEGAHPRTATFPIRVLGALGISVLIVTNASGGLNNNYSVGDIMIINDHISFPSLSGSYNPLIGASEISQPNGNGSVDQRFLALSDAYDYDLRKTTWDVWNTIIPQDRLKESSQGSSGRIPDKKRNLQEGTYAFVAGPSYETRAEARLLSNLGADVVGMSTVPEIIVARRIGLRVLGLSLVTNMVVQETAPRGDNKINNYDNNISAGKASHAEVLEAGKLAAEIMKDLIIGVVERLPST